MINFLRRLFCLHVWEFEQDIFTEETIKVCRKCDVEKGH